MIMIAIIDYGMGNLRSVQKGFERVGCPAFITSDRKKIEDAAALVLPGVGAFKEAMENLGRAGLIEVIRSSISKGKPFLGICLGLHLLFTKGFEFGESEGLDVIPGKVVPFQGEGFGAAGGLKVPHMGWNAARPCKDSPFLGRGEKYFYFVHSYYVVPEEEDVVLATTEYGAPFVSAIWKDNILAVQFHPEKSQEDGLAVLRKFGGMAGK
ncbi:MAG: imidazole glycerol phosphate synthase subunit HisH [Nitrospinae bacterium]|nr:imidazole glycerol phosphate synthase subunit HisH [Nitrospinota bacterium]